MPLGPQTYVDAPPLSPPPNGLLRSATVIEHPDEEHWGGDMVWAPEGGADLAVYDPCVGGPLGTYSDGVTTDGTTTFTSATAAFTAADVGQAVVGQHVPAGAFIVSVESGTSVTLSQAAVGSGTGIHFAVYGRTPTLNHPAGLHFTPFAVSATDSCSAFGFEAADYEGRARRALAARESKAVEAQWWTSKMFPANPHLDASGSAPTATKPTTVAGGPFTRRLGLAQLVQALADHNGGVGMIHARPFLVDLWMSENMLYRGSDGKLYTEAGVMIVPGRGYPGTGPGGEAVSATSEWAFATDPVEVHRGPVEVWASEADKAAVLAKDRNQIDVRAERLYGVAWNAVMNYCVNVNPAT